MALGRELRDLCQARPGLVAVVRDAVGGREVEKQRVPCRLGRERQGFPSADFRPHQQRLRMPRGPCCSSHQRFGGSSAASHQQSGAGGCTPRQCTRAPGTCASKQERSQQSNVSPRIAQHQRRSYSALSNIFTKRSNCSSFRRTGGANEGTSVDAFSYN